jgi:site-specific DNA-cytosine methylase
MKLTILHTAYLITYFLSQSASAKKNDIQAFLKVTPKTAIDFKNSLQLAIELDWIAQTVDSYYLTNAGARALSFKHWRLIKLNKKEKEVLHASSIKHFLIDSKAYKNRPTVVDLFAGVGGLSLGFESAGFEIVAAMDNDLQACEAHKKNFPTTTVIQDDINKFAKNPTGFLEKLGIKDDIDGVIGGPPCQGFSNMGERVVDDDRNFLTTRFTDIVNGLKPKFFMMENVSGLKTIGIRPSLDKYLIDLAKPIGLFAGQLVDALPEISKVYAKRGPQFKKRLISTAVSNFKRLMLAFNTGEYEGKAALKFVKKSQKTFQTAFIAACEFESLDLAHDQNWMKSALSSVSKQVRAIQIIGLGIFCDIRKSANADNWDQFLNEIVNLEEKSGLGLALKDIANAYRSQPTASRFQGESIGPVLAGIINRVKDSYKIYGPKVLNAYKYGAPQSRQRLFLIGIRKDLPSAFFFPDEIFDLPSNSKTSGLSFAPTCEDALNDLPDIDTFAQLIASDEFSAEHLSPPDNDYAKYMRLYEIEKNDWSLPRITWNPLIVDCSTRTIHSEEVINRLKQTNQGIQDKKSGKTRLKRNGVSHTLRAGTKEEKGSHTAVRPVHYEHHRVISVREGARLMGFPDWMTFHPTKWHGFRLVGNAVPFQLGQSVARSIMKTLKPD